MATASKDLKNFCEHYAKKYNRKESDLETGLELFALHVFAQGEFFVDSILEGEKTENRDLSEWHVGGTGDLNIDAILYDQVRNVVQIIQTKYKKNAPISQNDVDEATSFFANIDNWSDVDYVSTNGNEAVQNLLSSIGFDPKNQEILLTFVTSKVLDEDEKLSRVAEQAESSYRERNLNISCRVFGATELVTQRSVLRESMESEVLAEQAFNVSNKFQFEFDNGEAHRVLVTAIKGNELKDLYWREGVRTKLFNSNIRLAMGTGTKVNPKIQKTARENGENFFYFNNGVTATCSEYLIDKNGRVSAKHLQVVNGAQTVKQIAEALKRNPNDRVYVLLRLIETGEAGKRKNQFAEDITRFQNTQNPVRESDFYSNDDFQLYLRDNLSKTLSGHGACAPFWYCHKRGYEPSNKPGRRVTLEELAMLRHAVLNGPQLSYASPKSLWDGASNGDLEYLKAFGSNGVRVESWSIEEMNEVGWMITTLFRIHDAHADQLKKKKNGEEVKADETGHLKNLSRFITSLVYVALREGQRKDAVPEFKEIMASTSTFDFYIKDPLKIARRLVDEKLQDLKKGKGANVRLNLGRSEEMWDELREKLLVAIDREEIMNDWLTHRQR